MKQWIMAAIAVLCTACQGQAAPAAVQPPVVVEVTEVAPMIPTATPDCQHTDGVTLKARRISDTKVELQVGGLQPGEKPYITFDASFSSGVGMRIESGQFVEGADAQGNFTFEQGGLMPPEGESSATWDIRFIHARGVECAAITLP
jgi:hypothetical protein